MNSSPADRVLREIEGERRGWFLPIIGRERGAALVEVVRNHRPKRVLEVGTLVGYSTILIAKELDEGSDITTIEIDEDEAEMARKNIRRAQVRPRVDVLVGDAIELLPSLDGPFDLVFLDADKSEYMRYLELVESKLPSGSVVVADNAGSSSRSMGDYLDHVRDSGLYESRFVKGGWDGLEISVKK